MIARPRWRSLGLVAAFFVGPVVATASAQAVRPAASPTPPGDPPRPHKLNGWAGFGGMMGQVGLGKSSMIVTPAVQADLKLTTKQKAALRDWVDAQQSRAEKAAEQQQQPANPDDPDAAGPNGFNPLALAETIRQSTRDSEEGLDRILTPRQRERLDQISVQMQGLAALARPDVAAAVNLSPEQVEAIREILDRSRADQAGLMMRESMNARASFGPDDPKKPKATPPRPAASKKAGDSVPVASPSMVEQSDRLQTETMLRINKVLTRRQRDRFEKLLGEPFDPTLMTRLPDDPAPDPTKPAPATASPPVKPSAPAAPRPSRLRDSRLGKDASTAKP